MFRLSFIFLCLQTFVLAKNIANFSAIDWNVRNIEAPTVDSLAKKLTASYQTELKKQGLFLAGLLNIFPIIPGYIIREGVTARQICT